MSHDANDRWWERALRIAVPLACLVVIVWIATPTQHGPRTEQWAFVGRQLDDKCLLVVAEEADSGLTIIPRRVHEPIPDSAIDETGRPTALSVAQKHMPEGWSVVVRARSVENLENSPAAQSYAESVTRTVAMRVLERCAHDTDWNVAFLAENLGVAFVFAGPVCVLTLVVFKCLNWVRTS